MSYIQLDPRLLAFQLLSSSETARLAILVLLAQILVTVGVSVFIVRKARAEIDGHILESSKAKAADATIAFLEQGGDANEEEEDEEEDNRSAHASPV